MKWLLRVVVGLVVAVAGMAGVGWMLPVNHEAVRRAAVAQPPAEVYALVADVKNYPAWWPDISQVDIMVDEPARTTFREHMSTGPVIMTVVEATPPSRFVTKIDDADQPFGGTWTFEIASAARGGSEVTLTERGEIYNPVFRFLSRYVFGYTGTIDSCLAALTVRLG